MSDSKNIIIRRRSQIERMVVVEAMINEIITEFKSGEMDMNLMQLVSIIRADINIMAFMLNDAYLSLMSPEERRRSNW